MVLKNIHIPQHIGIIGGMGPFAGQRFVRHVLEYARDAFGARTDEEYPKMSIESFALPTLTAHGINDAAMYLPLLISTLKQIEQNGAKAIAIPCNTIHALHTELQQAVSIRVFNIVEETVEKVVSENCDRPYILATGSTISTHLYQTALQARGKIAINPSTENQKRVEALITILEQGIVTSEALSLYSFLTKEAIAQGADSLVLGCTELTYLTNEKVHGLRVIDSSRVLAEKLVDFAYST